MAFLKYANATLVKPAISMPAWDEVRNNATVAGPAFDKRQAAKVGLQKFNPNEYLLSHCTIIASVDTESPNAQLGNQLVDGTQIDRRYADYYIAANSSKYVNNNNDSWERKLLLSCFRTFMGAENYVEHLQIPELSKGKVIDAAARDVGDSVYVDILVATDKKHQPLIQAISSGQLQTLSMGCQVQFTLCSKCGNVAEDETQLCSHIRFMKGNSFIDETGNTRKIAELCGHVSAEPGSVRFIEASWVANPAFTGAVLRNILTEQEVKALGNRVQVAFMQPTRVADPNYLQKAARSTSPPSWNTKTGQWGGEEGGEEAFEGVGEQSGEAERAAAEDPLEKAVGELVDHIRTKAVEKVRSEIGKAESPSGLEDLNETLIKSAVRNSPSWHRIARVLLKNTKNPVLSRRIMAGLIHHQRGGWKSVQAQKLTGREILAVSRFVDLFNRGSVMAGENRIFRAVIAVGGAAPYGDVDIYLTACRQVFGRELTASEKEALIIKGRLYDLGS